MASLQIRNLPDDVYQALSRKAEREGRSLAQQAVAELRKLEELERRERRLAVIARLREEVERDGLAVLDPPPEDLIREDRDR